MIVFSMRGNVKHLFSILQLIGEIFFIFCGIGNGFLYMSAKPAKISTRITRMELINADF